MTLPIFESKTSDKTIRFVSFDNLTEYCSPAYARKIIAAQQNGQLWGLYLTKTGRIKATFI